MWTGSTSTMKRYYYAGQTRIAMRTGSLLNWLFGDHLGPSAALQGYNSTSRVAGMIFTVTR